MYVAAHRAATLECGTAVKSHVFLHVDDPVPVLRHLLLQTLPAEAAREIAVFVRTLT